MRSSITAFVLTCVALAAVPLQSAANHARAELLDQQGMNIGEVTLTQTPGGTLLHAKLSNLTPGAHAFHVHAVGVCEAPFTSAGGHFNPEGEAHGILGMTVGQRTEADSSMASQQAVLTTREFLGETINLILPFDTDEEGNVVPGLWHAQIGQGHVGDMPNIYVPASGELEIEVLNSRLKLDYSLFDEDGAAIVIHDGADDYATDPAGAAGPRVACGVIVKEE